MECCTGDFCNNGSFPYLPEPKAEIPEPEGTDEILKLCLAVFAPVVIVGLIAGAVILCMRKNHKKRLIDARIQQDADTYYATDDLLKRSHACGDSTLRVSCTELNDVTTNNRIHFSIPFRNISINQLHPAPVAVFLCSFNGLSRVKSPFRNA